MNQFAPDSQLPDQFEEIPDSADEQLGAIDQVVAIGEEAVELSRQQKLEELAAVIHRTPSEVQEEIADRTLGVPGMWDEVMLITGGNRNLINFAVNLANLRRRLEDPAYAETHAEIGEKIKIAEKRLDDMKQDSTDSS